MNIPFTALYFASYETAKRATMKHANCEESLLIQGVAGAARNLHCTKADTLNERPVRGAGCTQASS